MSRIDLSARTPTVTRYRAGWPRWFARTVELPKRAKMPTASPARDAEDASATPYTTARTAAADHVEKRNAGREASNQSGATSKKPPTIFGLLAREALTLAGMAGALLTIIAHLGWHTTLALPFFDLSSRWILWTSSIWRDVLGGNPEFDNLRLQGAMTLGVCLALIGLGAFVSRQIQGAEETRKWRFVRLAALPGLLLAAATIPIFAWGFEPFVSANPFDNLGARERGQSYIVMSILAGYAVGDLFGRQRFQSRIFVLAAALVLLLAVNGMTLPNR